MENENHMKPRETANKRIAKNTLVLYLRMVFILCVGLFTSRVVLNTLGVEDYGLYNVVGGFVAFFTFLNGAMATATQRFITFELARGDLQRQRTTFSTSVIIHFALAAIIVLFAETVGLWFVYHKLVIPEGRFTAALWVYHLSVAAMFISIISIPYNALIIAHEKMSAFAFISIMDTVLKLVIVYFLTVVTWDKLIFYALLLFLIGVLDRFIYGVYCSRHFKEAGANWTFDKRLFKEMTNIAGWSLFGNLAGIFYTQGLNVLLNMFFGPAVNAARGISVTVQGIVSNFVSNFQMALNPQITKSYASNNLQRMHSLVFASSKFSFFLLFLIVLPIMIEAKGILTVWLKIVPAHTVWFLRLILCIMLIEALANPLMISSQAVGRVKVYQSAVGGILLLILPISYIVLYLGGNPESVFIVHLCMAAIAQAFRIIIVSRMINLPLGDYCRQVLLRIAGVFIIASLLSVCIFQMLPPDSLWAGLSTILMTAIITAASILLIGLTRSERQLILSKITALLHKVHTNG